MYRISASPYKKGVRNTNRLSIAGGHRKSKSCSVARYEAPRARNRGVSFALPLSQARLAFTGSKTMTSALCRRPGLISAPSFAAASAIFISSRSANGSYSKSASRRTNAASGSRSRRACSASWTMISITRPGACARSPPRPASAPPRAASAPPPGAAREEARDAGSQ